MDETGSAEPTRDSVPGNKSATDSTKSHYRRLHDQCGEVISVTFDHGSRLQAAAHSYIDDFDLWIDVLDNRTERPVLERAMREYQFGLLAVAQGTYRHAFMALRLSLELTLNGIYLSAYEKDLRGWLLGERETGIRSILNRDDGLFSLPFARVFNSALEDSLAHYRSLADDVYSECSDYAHGKLTTERRLPESIEFSADVFERWHDRGRHCEISLLLRSLSKVFKGSTARAAEEGRNSHFRYRRSFTPDQSTV